MSARTASTAQLADALGVTKNTAQARALAEGWPYEQATGRGGVRRLYLVESLPPSVRAKLVWSTPAAHAAQSQVPVVPDHVRAAGSAGRAAAQALMLGEALQAKADQVRREQGLVRANALSAAGQLRMDSRLAVLRAFEAHRNAVGLSLAESRLAFAAAYNAGTVQVAADVRQAVPRTSADTLRLWQRAVRQQGIDALAGAYGNRAGQSRLDADSAQRDLVRAMLVATPHCKASHIMQGLRARFPATELPSNTSLQRWVAVWRKDNAEVLAVLSNPDGWRNKYMTAFGSRSEDVTRVNQRWELDSSPADLMCTDGRYSLIAGIDVHSRMPRMLVAKTSKAEGVAGLLRRMLLDLGVPEEVKTDNGSDYTSKHVVRVLGEGLDVQHTLCDPFSPDQKPHIERFFGTFSRDLAELLPGYTGHNVAERKAIEARRSFAERLMKRSEEAVEVRLTGKELQAFCDRWVEDVYQHNPHEGLGKRTPFEVCASLGEERRRIDDERALDVLLAPAPENGGVRTVQKKGIKVDNAWFIAHELHNWVGETVQVRFDALDHDLGRLFVFGHIDGMGEQQFVCIAECPARTGMDRREVAAKSRHLQRQHILAAKRALKANAKRVGTDELVQEVLRERAAAAGKLTVLPTRGLTYTSNGLAAAASAARTAGAGQRTSADIANLAEVQATQARIAAQAVPKGTPNELAARRGVQAPPVFETVGARMQWLMQQARVRELTQEERDSLAEYRRTQPGGYRRMQLLVSEQARAQPADPQASRD